MTWRRHTAGASLSMVQMSVLTAQRGRWETRSPRTGRCRTCRPPEKPPLNGGESDEARSLDRSSHPCLPFADVAELVTLVPIGTLMLIEDWQGAGSGGSSETRYERRVYPAALSLPAP